MHVEDWDRPLGAHLLIGRLLREAPKGLTTYRLQRALAKWATQLELVGVRRRRSKEAGRDDDRPLYGGTLTGVVLACRRLEEHGIVEARPGKRKGSTVWRLTTVGREWLEEQLERAAALLGGTSPLATT